MTPEQLEILRGLAAECNYGRGPDHAKQVLKLSLGIYDELDGLNMLRIVAEDKQILEAAALLHDIGVGREPHNEIAFDKLTVEIPKRMNVQPLSQNEFSAVLYCILFHRGHRGHDFSQRNEVQITDPVRTKRLAAILRVADGLDHGPPFDAPVREVTLRIVDEPVICRVEPVSREVNDRVKQYVDHTSHEKVDLFRRAFGKELAIEILEC